MRDLVKTRGRRAALAAFVFLLAACGPGDAGKPAAATHPDSAAAIRRCEAGVTRAASVRIEEKATVVMAECRFLYSRPACRDAWEARPEPGTAVRVVRACRDAYCGDLPATRPALCGAWPADDDDALAGWADLDDAILKLEHGEPDARSRAFLRVYASLARVFIVGVGTKLSPVQ